MTSQFNIQVGDEVAVFTYWAKLPKKHKVSLVTPTGKIRVEGLDGLITPKDTYDHATNTRSWSGRVGHEYRTTSVYPWTEAHDRRIVAAQQERDNNARIHAIKERVAQLHHSHTHQIEALCRLLDIP